MLKITTFPFGPLLREDCKPFIRFLQTMLGNYKRFQKWYGMHNIKQRAVCFLYFCVKSAFLAAAYSLVTVNWVIHFILISSITTPIPFFFTWVPSTVILRKSWHEYQYALVLRVFSCSRLPFLIITLPRMSLLNRVDNVGYITFAHKFFFIFQISWFVPLTAFSDLWFTRQGP